MVLRQAVIEWLIHGWSSGRLPGGFGWSGLRFSSARNDTSVLTVERT
ncbi:hypothetical protein CHELA1G11_20747 [Hyphomicrobiales bacterium]|nr:hypothetical protein CHELA1G11_20747 [Hyphomicrobiales bacterium]